MDYLFYRKLKKISRDSSLNEMSRQYERYPYPRLPLLARVRSADSYLMNYQAGIYSVFGSNHFAVPNPRILVAGSGTFEPCIVALANPTAKIVAVDLSRSSLKRLQMHLLRHRVLGAMEYVHGDVLSLDNSYGKFDYIIATGLLHHLPNPSEGLRLLAEKLAPNGIMRIMLYSKHGREKIYQIRDFAKNLGLRRPETLKVVLDTLPKNHPLRINFHLYGDSSSLAGIVDGFLHVSDQGFDALDCEDYLSVAHMVAKKFLHPVGSRPEDMAQLVATKPDFLRRARALSDWEKLAVLDRLRELETNFNFIACRESDWESNQILLKQKSLIEGNPVLIAAMQSMSNRLLRKKLYSRLARKYLPIDGDYALPLIKPIEREELERYIGQAQVKEYLDSMIYLENRG